MPLTMLVRDLKIPGCELDQIEISPKNLYQCCNPILVLHVPCGSFVQVCAVFSGVRLVNLILNEKLKEILFHNKWMRG